MEHNNTNTLDIRTLLMLLVSNEMPKSRTLELIARECNMPAEDLIKALTFTDKRRVTRWDAVRREELVQRWNAGEKPRDIAAAMNISTQSVYQNIAAMRHTRTDIVRRRTPAFLAGKQS